MSDLTQAINKLEERLAFVENQAPRIHNAEIAIAGLRKKVSQCEERLEKTQMKLQIHDERQTAKFTKIEAAIRGKQKGEDSA